MSYTEKHIVETYSALFESLSSESKLELIEQLSKSLETEEKTKEAEFYKSFGAFGSDKSASEIVEEIRAARKFKKKDIKF